MSTTVFLAVIAAAILHAGWNAVVKGGVNKNLSMLAIVLGHVPLALIALPLVPAPSEAAWPYILASIALHFFYQIFLLFSYRVGELTQVYPIARGSAPLLVAAISVIFLGVTLKPLELLATLTIAIGILSMSMVRQNNGQKNVSAATLAFVTGCFIAAYSLVDGLGARLSDSVLGYYSWISIGNAVIFLGFMLIREPALFQKLPKNIYPVFLLGGSGSFIAYSLVIWAFTKAPIALVTALRETSIIFALLIGVFFLKEKMDLAKVVSTMVTLLGAAMLRFSKQ